MATAEDGIAPVAVGPLGFESRTDHAKRTRLTNLFVPV